MADKENANRTTWRKNNIMMEKNCIPLKPNELTTSAIGSDTHNCEDNNPLSFLLVKDDPEIEHMPLNQTFYCKRNTKEKLMPTEKPKQDVNIPKKPVLGFYRGKVVESKINSFRKPLQVKDESSAANKKPSAIVLNASRPQPVSTSAAVKSYRATNATTTTKIVSTVSQNRQLVQPPPRSYHDNTLEKIKQGIGRPSANVTVRKGTHRKESIPLRTDLSSVKTSASQDIKGNKARSRSTASDTVARAAPSSNIKQTEKSETIDPRRHTMAKAIVSSRSAQPRETPEQRSHRAHLTEWKASKGRVPKRPPSSVVTQPEAAGQNEKPARSFWTTMAEEDEQRLFTEKVNKTFSECLSLISEGCPKEEILLTLNDLIKNIPDAKKLVKYWVCLARLEPITSPIEHIITIYEKAILAGAQPIEEMRHAITDILTMKSQEKVNLRENIEEACATEEQVHKVNSKDIGGNLEPGKPKMENKHHRSMFHDCEKEQEKTKDPVNGVKTPDKETRESCLIKYNISTTPYLQSAKKKMQFDETNSLFKELKFLTPVRRSQRIQDKTSKLPDMLKDHYPCVSSLEQLAELGHETDAFVCRPNAALCPMYSEIETEEK